MKRKTLNNVLKQAVLRAWPFGFFAFRYRQSSRSIGSASGERTRMFQEFLSRCDGPCIQIAVKDEIGKKFGPNWVSIDKYDHHEVIDRHDDVESLQFENDTFNAAVCWSVLEHVPHPQIAIGELYRVLKPGGLIWVQVPFLFPYHAAPNDFWRVTPSGLRIWMKDFDEIACACDYWAETKLVAGTYFYGKKR